MYPVIQNWNIIFLHFAKKNTQENLVKVASKFFRKFLQKHQKFLQKLVREFLHKTFCGNCLLEIPPEGFQKVWWDFFRNFSNDSYKSFTKCFIQKSSMDSLRFFSRDFLSKHSRDFFMSSSQDIFFKIFWN